jgi:sulfur carrier protein|tara:strand:- start:1007 stop:1210 length:204 start_codon:yes stop_codon:yes gene_type:complete
MISITVNGDKLKIEEDSTIEILLELLNITPARLAIEINGEVIPRSEILAKVLQEGDILEIVKAIGGG